MKASERLSIANSKVRKMPAQTQGYYYYPHVVREIRDLIIKAEEEGKGSVGIEDLLKAIEAHTD